VLEPSLERISALVDVLGEPHRGYPVVHLTGTNGKTSTARMVDALLSEIGLRTGRYTSPHLQRATERINIDNRPVSPERYVEVYRTCAPFVDLVDRGQPVRLSKFEILTAMGVRRVRRRARRGGLVEVGLGGRWDATNVADGTVAVVTPIGLDHAEFLGTDVLGHRPGEGRDHQARRGGRARRPGQGRGRGAAGALRRGRRPGRREGAEFGRGRREIAVGGQRLVLRGLAGDRRDLPAAARRAPGRQRVLALAAAEALIGPGPRQPLDPDAVRAGVRRRVTSPGGWSAWPAGQGVPTGARRRLPQPAGARALAAALTTGVPLHPAGRRPRGHARQGRPRASSPSWSRCCTEVVVTAQLVAALHGRPTSWARSPPRSSAPTA
jgi:dihydrofolate synthase/folylpolyglutamate synthase